MNKIIADFTSRVWKPCRTPVQDWPLAVCDANSVDEDDLVPTDVIYPKWVAENCMVQFNIKQKWYWLQDHQGDELLVFKAYDSGRSQSWRESPYLFGCHFHTRP